MFKLNKATGHLNPLSDYIQITVSHSKQVKTFYGYDFMATEGLTFLTIAPHFPHMYHSVTLWFFCWFFMRVRDINNRLRLQLHSEAYPQHGRKSNDGFFGGNSLWVSALNYFHKKLHLRSLAGIHLQNCFLLLNCLPIPNYWTFISNFF